MKKTAFFDGWELCLDMAGQHVFTGPYHVQSVHWKQTQMPAAGKREEREERDVL
ncbi:MAG: hypothetical protein Q4D81_09980 [Eubacteriales bacterium]|nr:hypothetical protein [Eubacteriales bacterium]